MLVEWPDDQKHLHEILEGVAKIKGKPVGEYLAELIRKEIDALCVRS